MDLPSCHSTILSVHNYHSTRAHTSDTFIYTPRHTRAEGKVAGNISSEYMKQLHNTLNEIHSHCVEIVILNAMCLWPCWWRMNKLRRLEAFAVSPLWSLDISWCVLYDCVKYFHYTRRVTSKHGVRSKSDCQLFVSTVFFSNHAVIQASTAV